MYLRKSTYVQQRRYQPAELVSFIKMVTDNIFVTKSQPPNRYDIFSPTELKGNPLSVRVVG